MAKITAVIKLVYVNSQHGQRLAAWGYYCWLAPIIASGAFLVEDLADNHSGVGVIDGDSGNMASGGIECDLLACTPVGPKAITASAN